MKKTILYLILSLTSFVSLPIIANAAPIQLTVYKDANCSCCTEWISYMEKSGYKIKVVTSENINNIKVKYNIPDALKSCHTSIIESSGQLIEGHVPVNAVEKLVKSPNIKGISVPGMEANSPGMGKMDGNLITMDFKNNIFSKD